MKLIAPSIEYDEQIQAYRNEFGIDKVLVCCVQGNEGSKKTILNNGGEYESTVYLKERDVYLERYWIDLTETA